MDTLEKVEPGSKDSDSQFEELLYQFREDVQLGRYPVIDNYLSRITSSRQLDFVVSAIEAEMQYRLTPTVIQVDNQKKDEDEIRVEPRLELYLHRFPFLVKSNRACMELALFEFAFRARMGAFLEIEHYERMFPHLAKELRSNLARAERQINRGPIVEREKKDVNKTNSTIIDRNNEPLPNWKLPRILGCFQLLSVIGSGGMGTVFRAFDLRTGAIVAVKVTRRLDSWSVYRFNEEFRALATLDHPNLVKLFEAFNDDQVRYFSMELINGRKLHNWWLTQVDSNKWDQFQARMSQVASAIQYLHSRGLVHADIKCSNIVVARNRAVLLDFGLASFVSPDLHPVSRVDDDRLAGTLAYLAPEIIARQSCTTASDWYSFGVVLFELITGKLPFSEGDRSEFVDLSPEDEALLRAQNCPPAVCDVCQQLLSFDPARRPWAPAVFAALHSSSHIALPHVALDGMTDYFGQESNLERLNKIAQDDCKCPQWVIVHGPVGIGRSRLLAEWTRQLQSTDRIVIRASGFRQDIARCGMINLLAQSFVAQSPKHIKLNELVTPEQLDVISEAFPQILQLVENQASTTAGPKPQCNPKATLDAGARYFLQLLVRLSEQKQVMLALDDFQWADPHSLQALFEMLSQATSSNILIAIAVRSDLEPQEATLGNLTKWIETLRNLKQGPKISEIKLEPLDDKASYQMASSLLSQVGLSDSDRANCAGLLAKACHGKPQFMVELLRILLDSGITADQWGERIVALESSDPTEFRFQRLEKPHQQILQLMAVARAPATFSQLQMASRVGPDLLLPVLGELASGGWIRWYGIWPDLSVDLLHDSMRERIIRITPQDRVARRHNRWVQVLSRETNTPWSQIGEHLVAAGSQRRAITAFIEAALSLANTTENEEIIRLISRAQSLGSLTFEQDRIVQNLLDSQNRSETDRCIESIGKAMNSEDTVSDVKAPKE
jgi:eukaryotic-like serine/threonine-protein kinase